MSASSSRRRWRRRRAAHPQKYQVLRTIRKERTHKTLPVHIHIKYFPPPPPRSRLHSLSSYYLYIQYKQKSTCIPHKRAVSSWDAAAAQNLSRRGCYVWVSVCAHDDERWLIYSIFCRYPDARCFFLSHQRKVDSFSSHVFFSLQGAAGCI